ncbi:MAG: SBBP repeat-containing protein [Bacteroidia bacterium]|nr:SBBP repeat-containing protein [Bacteroidia bacterium]
MSFFIKQRYHVIVFTWTISLGGQIIAKDMASSQGFFIENKGQWVPEVLYLYVSKGMYAWVTSQGLNLTLQQAVRPLLPLSPTIPPSQRESIETANTLLIGHRLRIQFEASNLHPHAEGLKKRAGYYNYFYGDNPSNYVSSVGLYEEVWIREIYPGISIRYYVDQGGLRYDYWVAPGADPSQIRFRIHGAEKVEIQGKRLILTTSLGEIELCDLRTYQAKHCVESCFIASGNVYQIAVGKYDPQQPLIIDPLVYSTYLGGSREETAHDIAVNDSGYAYIVGSTFSADYDTSVGGFQTVYGGGKWDAFITKLDVEGKELVYSTFIGGIGEDQGRAIVVDKNGHAYITGWTDSPNFPISSTAFQKTKAQWRDVFVAKFSADGKALLYSTYLGGVDWDEGYSIAVDISGQAYVTGRTASPDYPVTAGAFQTVQIGRSWDVFVTKLNADGTNLVYSTYIGGSDYDEGHAIDIDSFGQAYIGGSTLSADYPVTEGAFQMINAGSWDVFVAKLSPNGDALLYSTYIGGSEEDRGGKLAVNQKFEVYVAGYTTSMDFPVTMGTFQETHKGGYADAFVAKLSLEDNSLIYSTYLGGSGWDEVQDLAIDKIGRVCVTGTTYSLDYPVTPGAFHTGEVGVLITVIDTAGGSVLYSTYVGGTDWEAGLGIVIDEFYSIYVTGYTYSSDYPVTTAAFQPAYGGGLWEAFCMKLNPTLPTSQENISAQPFWRIYPNPTTGILTVEISSGKQGTFQMTDAKGRIVEYYRLPEGKHTLYLSLQPGIYYLYEQESRIRQKVIVVGSGGR